MNLAIPTPSPCAVVQTIVGIDRITIITDFTQLENSIAANIGCWITDDEHVGKRIDTSDPAKDYKAQRDCYSLHGKEISRKLSINHGRMSTLKPSLEPVIRFIFFDVP